MFSPKPRHQLLPTPSLLGQSVAKGNTENQRPFHRPEEQTRPAGRSQNGSSPSPWGGQWAQAPGWWLRVECQPPFRLPQKQGGCLDKAPTHSSIQDGRRWLYWAPETSTQAPGWNVERKRGLGAQPRLCCQGSHRLLLQLLLFSERPRLGWGQLSLGMPEGHLTLAMS